ncbi:MAG TPA: D-glycerate dehydrogenase [Terriglobia bacterium]|nr:D-glycerate dehydrogenase [Terriglobia bacterium]
MKPKVFITRPMPEAVVQRLAADCQVESHSEDTSLTEEELTRVLSEHHIEGLLLAGARVTARVLNAAPELRVVANAGVGYDNVDVAACSARRIPVTNTGGVLEETTADLAFALLLAVARRVVEGDGAIRHGDWKQWSWSLLWGSDIHHQTLGIYGLGNIGRALARRARGFSMRILYHSRHRVDPGVEHEMGAEFVGQETLLRESDFLSLHFPLTPETHHRIGKAELALMKRSAFLINTARGNVVDEQALVEALEAGRLAGAGLDVFEHEPRVHPALLKLPNVVLTPHVGSATAATRFKMASLAAENMLAALQGRRPPNVVNPEIYG